MNLTGVQTGNTWTRIPISLEWANHLYESCKDDFFCFGTDTSLTAGIPGFWSVNTSNPDGSTSASWNGVQLGGCRDIASGCRKFSAIYDNGTVAVHQLWHSGGVNAFEVAEAGQPSMAMVSYRSTPDNNPAYVFYGDYCRVLLSQEGPAMDPATGRPLVSERFPLITLQNCLLTPESQWQSRGQTAYLTGVSTGNARGRRTQMTR